MGDSLSALVIFAYLVITLLIGLIAGARGERDASDFVAGDRAFGPFVLYFVMGAMLFSAYTLLGTPQRIMTRGPDVFYIIAFGSVCFVPMYYFGAKVRSIGAREGYVTQAELVGARFGSRLVTSVMGVSSLVAFLPYLLIQLKAAGLVMEAALGWDRSFGAAAVYAVVITYVVLGGMRGVGWTNVIQGVVMVIVVWALGIWIPRTMYGGVAAMFDQVVATRPEYIVLPGPAERPTSAFAYTSEVLVSALGFTMWPQVFMKCFTARSARLVRFSVVVFPSFLIFIVPLIFLGYAALLQTQAGAPSDETVILWLVQHPEFGGGPIVAAFLSFAILAASMSTGDALLHGAGSIFVRDVLVVGLGFTIDARLETRVMRAMIVVFGALGVCLLELVGETSVVDLLLLGYAIPLQFLPPVILGLYWRRATRAAAEWGLCCGLGTVVALFCLNQLAPALYARLNPFSLELGVFGLAINLALMVGLTLARSPAGARATPQPRPRARSDAP